VGIQLNSFGFPVKRLIFSALLLSNFFFVNLHAVIDNPQGAAAGPAKNKVILITGASSGIGWETAKKLASHGYRVYASMRSVKSFSHSQESTAFSIELLELDVTDDQSVDGALSLIQEKEGRLDVLINNAGCAVFGPLETIAMVQARKTFEVNFFGVMRMMQAVLPLMREQKAGLIINVSSTSGIRPSPGWDIYAASKYALEGLSEAVAAMMRLWNVRVVIVEPGATATDFMTKSTEIGSRRIAKTFVYDDFLSNALSWMQSRIRDGQPAQEVANIMASIVATENPPFRYQTSLKGMQTVASRHRDTSGESSIQEQLSLLSPLWSS